MAANDYAILVGITRYPGLGDLQGAEGDARRFRDWLVDPEGGAVPPENVELIVTSRFHPPEPACVEEAEPADIHFERALRKLTMPGGIPRRQVGRRLYLYFSGHGFTTMKRPEAALYVASATLSSPDQIAGTQYLEILKAAALFDELVLVMDCCRTLEMLSQISPPHLIFEHHPTRANQVKAFLAYGAPNGLQARERFFEQEGRVEGILTHALLDALRRAKGDAQGRVTGPQIKSEILTSWAELTRDVPAALPEIDITHAEDLIFATRPVAPLTEVILETRKEPHEGEVVILNGGLTETMRVQLALGRAETRLARGLYKAILPVAGREKLFQVQGTRVEVSLDA